MELLAKIYKISVCLLILVVGIMTGREIETKNQRIAQAFVAEEELQNKVLLEQNINEIDVYFDSLEEGAVYLIIKNTCGSKLQEVSLMNMKINGQKVEHYSYLDGIEDGEIKRCVISFDTGETNFRQGDTVQITGDLYIRGSEYYSHKKIDIVTLSG